MQEIIKAFQQRLRMQRYAENTIKTYSGCLSKFLHAFEGYTIAQVTEQNIEN